MRFSPEPTRAAGLARLADFAPRSGRPYAEGRNHDPGPDRRSAVSGLSPYIRHRLLLESECIAAARAAQGEEAAGKFVQEVLWRSYWKGWLELRPAEWDAYARRVAQAAAALPAQSGLRRAHAAAARGETGIDCFDAWARDLAETGYLHNHARMWFASIWIFTLRLPWVLGADLFLRHLLDGDAASNTLSWRWVLGSQTPGKHYVARAANIARYTDGRFDPAGALAEDPDPVVEPHAQPPGPLPPAGAAPAGRVALLLHEDDLHPESLDLGRAEVVAVAGFAVPERRSPLPVAPGVAAFARAALADGLARAGRHFAAPAEALAPEDVAAWAEGTGCKAVVTPWAPVGWTASALAGIGRELRGRGIALHPLRRDWDEASWPLATKGFFGFRERAWPLLEHAAQPAA
ncbi:FAD-binding domain-containing protein [Paracraurococcus ruber]|uniref:Cryptochrome/DNA photolyase FAD-binding domain-containing protein n=1 Tax=Paracraurococcus ruber TaxID=77675 RepID=A0ABS1D5H3_9PROT|nr:FAD-binding domain-containing protein [Paracraurococcus ruber]MBK1661337.1 hypothetical protein [Paracraurococcus ruber]TDG22557.1 deoxyribodipyrimidine photolyase [Paracraurococcus ruber]